MKTWKLSTLAFISAVGLCARCFADDEHSDVEFAYANGTIAIILGDEGSVFEGEFPTEGADLLFTSEPGFGSEREEGLGIGAGNQIVYNVLSDLMYWNDGFNAVPQDVQIRIANRPPSPVIPDTIIGVGTEIQRGSFDPALNRIGAAEANGDFHSDLDWLLEPSGDIADPSLYGVYGLIMSLSTDEAGVADSDPFAMVFNFGVEEENFELGVAAFASVVPESTGYTSVILSIAIVCSYFRRRAR